MHGVSLKKLRDFWLAHADAKQALRAWYREACQASWKSFSEVKARFGSADCLPDNRVVFNIKGNHYRIVVKVHYNADRLFIRFVGTHSEYSKINAETV